MKVKSLSHVGLFATPMDCSLPGSSFHGIFQARVLEWVAISFSRGSSLPRDRTQVSHIAGHLSHQGSPNHINGSYISLKFFFLFRPHGMWDSWFPNQGLNAHLLWKYWSLLPLDHQWQWAFPVAQQIACQCRNGEFNLWVRKIHWRRKWQPTPVFLPGESHGQRILVGYSPWGCRVRYDWICTHTQTETVWHWSRHRHKPMEQESKSPKYLCMQMHLSLIRRHFRCFQCL